MVPELLVVDALSQVLPEFTDDLINLVLLAPLEVDNGVRHFFREVLRMVLWNLYHLEFGGGITHNLGVKDVELCKIEVVVVLVEELESVLFVHIAAS